MSALDVLRWLVAHPFVAAVLWLPPWAVHAYWWLHLRPYTFPVRAWIVMSVFGLHVVLAAVEWLRCRSVVASLRDDALGAFIRTDQDGTRVPATVLDGLGLGAMVVTVLRPGLPEREVERWAAEAVRKWSLTGWKVEPVVGGWSVRFAVERPSTGVVLAALPVVRVQEVGRG